MGIFEMLLTNIRNGLFGLQVYLCRSVRGVDTDVCIPFTVIESHLEVTMTSDDSISARVQMSFGTRIVACSFYTSMRATLDNIMSTWF